MISLYTHVNIDNIDNFEIYGFYTPKDMETATLDIISKDINTRDDMICYNSDPDEDFGCPP
jgi:hypothetical protein